jgi:lactoylglutathione lyase
MEVKMATTKRMRSEAMDFRFIYTGIRVKNMDESIRFYTEVLGMEIVEKRGRTEPTKGEVITLKSPNSNQLLELNFYENDSPFYAPYENGEDLDHLAFDVENLEGTISDLRKKGVEIVVEPYQIGGNIGWKEAFVRDPNGIWIEFLQRK